MEMRNACGSNQRERERTHVTKMFQLPVAAAVLSIVCLASLGAGCGAPGEPVPPTPPVPVAVGDLSAHQAGDEVQLIFTLPTKTVAGDQLAAPPAVEVIRGVAQPDGSPDAKSLRVVSAIPGSLIVSYVSEGRVRITGPISPADVRANPRGIFVYAVRTRASRKHASANSNAVLVHLLPVPKRIGSVQAKITESAIELSWVAPTETSVGEPLAAISGYHIYRGELEPSSLQAASRDISQAKWNLPPALLATVEETTYRDTLFDFGKTYVYTVRSIVPVPGGLLESSDSEPAIVTPRDIFPPAAPQNVAAAVLPGAAPGAFVVDLSWSINLETDLAGYRVYRSEQQDTRGELVTPDLLPAPAYRDTSVMLGRRYWYSVTAVDRAGNESASSPAMLVDVVKPSS